MHLSKLITQPEYAVDERAASASPPLEVLRENSRLAWVRYWAAMDAIPPSKRSPQEWVMLDTMRDDAISARHALDLAEVRNACGF